MDFIVYICFKVIQRAETRVWGVPWHTMFQKQHAFGISCHIFILLGRALKKSCFSSFSVFGE